MNNRHLEQHRFDLLICYRAKRIRNALALFAQLAMLCCWSSLAFAMQAQPRTLISPVVNKPFEINIIPFTQDSFHAKIDENAANMGIDEDGCRHSSGFSEYDYYIVTCPYTLFSAVSAEWNERNSQFTATLSKNMIDWVLSPEGLGQICKETRERNYKVIEHFAQATGKVAVPFKDFVLEQEHVSIIDKYKYALRCYSKRGARPSFMGKVALTGAWAIRVHLNRQLTDPDLMGGIGELNTRVGHHIEEGEAFNIGKWMVVYENALKNKSLSNEAFLIASCTLLGLELRLGNQQKCRDIIDALELRLNKLPQDNKLRAIARERLSLLNTYRDFLDASVISLARAIAAEEVRRSQLPATMLAVAEGFRRSGQIDNAIDWYLAVDHMPETDHARRLALMEQGKIPLESDPLMVHFGWKAMKKVEEMLKDSPNRAIQIIGHDAPLLRAIVEQNLGRSTYLNPEWKPLKGAEITMLEGMLDQIGKTLIDYEFRTGHWPKTLGQMWDEGAIADWNRYNRFHCPVTGAAFIYTLPSYPRDQLLQKQTVLIACPQAVTTGEGERFLNYMSNDTMYWSKTPLKPGESPPHEH